MTFDNFILPTLFYSFEIHLLLGLQWYLYEFRKTTASQSHWTGIPCSSPFCQWWYASSNYIGYLVLSLIFGFLWVSPLFLFSHLLQIGFLLLSPYDGWIPIVSDILFVTTSITLKGSDLGNGLLRKRSLDLWNFLICMYKYFHHV